MKKIYLLFFVSINLFCNNLLSQDSILSKQIITKKFDLISFCCTKNEKDDKTPESEKDLLFFNDCNKVKPLSDSSFRLTHSDGSDVLLYKNIKTIIFFGEKSKFWDGVWIGAAIGAGFGLLVSLTHENHNPEERNKETNTLRLVAIGVPVVAFLGSITGGIIGALTKEKETYDLSKYLPDKRKEEALTIFSNFKIKMK